MTRILPMLPFCLAVASLAQSPGAAPACAARPKPAAYAVRGEARFRDALFQNVTVRKDILFSEPLNDRGQKEALRLDVYEPEGDTARLRPAVLLLHGGSFTHLSRNDRPTPQLGRELARRGYVAVALDYRLRTDTVRPVRATVDDGVEDALAAVAWLKRNAGELRVDPAHIAAAGESAGGILAGHLAERMGPELFGAVLLWSGLFNPVYPGLKAQIGACYPATVLICGTEDAAIGSALSTAKALGSAGVPFRFHQIEDGTHGLGQWEREYLSMTVEFLYELLTTGGAPRPAAMYEAESYSRKLRSSYQGGVPGQSGTGAMRLDGQGSYLEWNYVDVPAAGEYELAFRYAAGAEREGEARLRVNGAEAATLRFAPGGRPGEWKAVSARVRLDAGRNAVRLIAAETPGGAVLDRLDVVQR